MKSLSTFVVTHIAYTKSKLEIPCTDNMASAINDAKAGGIFHLELPDVYNPSKNIWAGDPMQIIEVLPIARNEGQASFYFCSWGSKHYSDDTCTCFHGNITANICDKIREELFPNSHIHKLSDEQIKNLRNEVANRTSMKK